MRASGDRIEYDQPAIVIMNHRTRLDWLYFWLALWRMNPWLMTSNKIALKELLKHVPGAGNFQLILIVMNLHIQVSECKRVNIFF